MTKNIDRYLKEKKENYWHEGFWPLPLCFLLGHRLILPSPRSEIEQCRACGGWRYR